MDRTPQSIIDDVAREVRDTALQFAPLARLMAPDGHMWRPKLPSGHVMTPEEHCLVVRATISFLKQWVFSSQTVADIDSGPDGLGSHLCPKSVIVQFFMDDGRRYHVAPEDVAAVVDHVVDGLVMNGFRTRRVILNETADEPEVLVELQVAHDQAGGVALKPGFLEPYAKLHDYEQLVGYKFEWNVYMMRKAVESMNLDSISASISLMEDDLVADIVRLRDGYDRVKNAPLTDEAKRFIEVEVRAVRDDLCRVLGGDGTDNSEDGDRRTSVLGVLRVWEDKRAVIDAAQAEDEGAVSDEEAARAREIGLGLERVRARLEQVIALHSWCLSDFPKRVGRSLAHRPRQTINVEGFFLSRLEEMTAGGAESLMHEMLSQVLRRKPATRLAFGAFCEVPPPERPSRPDGELIGDLVDAGPTWSEEARRLSEEARKRFVDWLSEAGEGAGFGGFLDSEAAAGRLTPLVEHGALQYGVLGPAQSEGLGSPRMRLVPKAGQEGVTRHRLDDGRTLEVMRLETRMVPYV